MATPGRLFVTGASGYVGKAITDLAIADGYRVYGLSRTEESDKKLRDLGATPVRGDLTSLDVLRRDSAEADAVIHLATAFQLGAGAGTYEDVRPIDEAAVDAIANGLAGSNKPLVITSGTLAAAADPSGGETDESSPLADSPVASRVKVEQYSLSLASRGIRVTGIRLAAYVYGRGGSGVAKFMGMSAKTGSVTCVDGGKNFTTCVHIDDGARLYLLAVQKGKAGELFNGSSVTDLRARQIFDAIAETLGVPVRDISYEDALKQFGGTFAWFLRAQNRASGAKARKELGWEPKGMGILEEIKKGSYQAVAKTLKQQ